jgi:hypothetical protein
MIRGMPSRTAGPKRAPLAARTAASLIDAAVMGAAGYALRTQGSPADERDKESKARRDKARRSIAPFRDALAEQVGSPGQWVVGVRLVDVRTGKRLALWRTVARAGLAIGSELLLDRYVRVSSVAHEQFRQEIERLRALHHEDSEALQQAVMLLYRDRGPVGHGLRPATVRLVGLARTRLTRMLARTVVVDVTDRRA